MSDTLSLTVSLVVVAWLTAAATAVRSVSRIWLRHWVERRLRGASAAAMYLERPQRLLVAAGTGIALATVAAGVTIARGATPGIAARDAAIFALALLAFGQLVPRAIAKRWAAPLLPVLLAPLQVLEVALRPLVALLRRLSPPRVMPGAATAQEEDDAELEDLLREGELEGVGEKSEIAIITGVVQFGRKTLGEVMTPRDDVFALDRSVTGIELARRVAAAGYSRVPVYDGSLDRVVGMVHAFDVLEDPEAERPPLRGVTRAAQDEPCDDVLFRMLKAGSHLAIVHDGGERTVGIVTLEDLLEELVGDIRDEHDEPAPAEESR